ncbi:MAG: carbonic anhydrase [Myxococcota bacterium]
MRLHPSETIDHLTPEDALQYLRDGNARFLSNLRLNRNLLQQVNETREGQWPFAAILSCIDSRTSAELIFDQGLGDLMSVRIAGNCLNDDILGSLEFSCEVTGATVVVVLGHSHCGAIKGACDGVEMGHLTGLLQKIRPSLDAIEEPTDGKGVLPEIRSSSTPSPGRTSGARRPSYSSAARFLQELVEAGNLIVVGGMYDVQSGAVEFL